MNASDLIKRVTADGVTLRLSVADEIKASGNKDALVRWLPELREHKTEIIQTLKGEPRFTDWRFHFDQKEMNLLIPDGATRVDVEAFYPSAVRFEPIQRPPSREATAAERDELRRLVNDVLSDAPEEVGEAFALGCKDIEAALVCYRSLMAFTVH